MLFFFQSNVLFWRHVIGNPDRALIYVQEITVTCGQGRHSSKNLTRVNGVIHNKLPTSRVSPRLPSVSDSWSMPSLGAPFFPFFLKFQFLPNVHQMERTQLFFSLCVQMLEKKSNGASTLLVKGLMKFLEYSLNEQVILECCCS